MSFLTIRPFYCAFLPFYEMVWSGMEISSAIRLSFVKRLGQNLSLGYPKAWLICAPNPLIWEV